MGIFPASNVLCKFEGITATTLMKHDGNYHMSCKGASGTSSDGSDSQVSCRLPHYIRICLIWETWATETDIYMQQYRPQGSASHVQILFSWNVKARNSPMQWEGTHWDLEYWSQVIPQIWKLITEHPGGYKTYGRVTGIKTMCYYRAGQDTLVSKSLVFGNKLLFCLMTSATPLIHESILMRRSICQVSSVSKLQMLEQTLQPGHWPHGNHFRFTNNRTAAAYDMICHDVRELLKSASWSAGIDLISWSNESSSWRDKLSPEARDRIATDSRSLVVTDGQ